MEKKDDWRGNHGKATVQKKRRGSGGELTDPIKERSGRGGKKEAGFLGKLLQEPEKNGRAAKQRNTSPRELNPPKSPSQ